MKDPKIEDIISRVNISQEEACYVIQSYIKEHNGQDVKVVPKPTMTEFYLFEKAYRISEEFYMLKYAKD